jgi:hypothetical protein
MTTSAAASVAASPARSRSRSLLRLALGLDAAVTGVNAVAYLAAASVLDGVLGLPAQALRGVGVFLLAFTAVVAVLASRRTVHLGAVRAVVAVNVLWVVDSVAAAVVGWGSPTAVGTTWIVLQAAVVAAFAGLQLRCVTGHRVPADPAHG